MISGVYILAASRRGVRLSRRQGIVCVLFAALISAGFYFGYTALERFIYPTPVWFTAYYAVTISAAALVKAALFLIYGVFEKKSQSPVIRIMKFDCILDFFITLMTLITLFVSKNGTYSIDAVFGIIISIIITVSAIRQVISSAKILVNYVPYAVREKVEESFNSDFGCYCRCPYGFVHCQRCGKPRNLLRTVH